MSKLHDSGKRKEYLSGAVREPQEGKGAYHLIPRVAIDRVAKIYEEGAKKYSDRNWEKGMPTSRYVDSMLRHAFKAAEGWTDEDHLAAVVFNAFAIMFNEEYYSHLDDRAFRDESLSGYYGDDTVVEANMVLTLNEVIKDILNMNIQE